MNPFEKTRNTVTPNTKTNLQEQLGVAEEGETVEEVVTPEPKKKQRKSPVAGLIEEKTESKNYAVYLDVDLVEEIDRIAKEHKTSRSKIMNVLLRQSVFGK